MSEPPYITWLNKGVKSRDPSLAREHARCEDIRSEGIETVLRSVKAIVIISSERLTVIIGECINPTGKKRLTAALQSGDLSLLKQEAMAQIGSWTSKFVKTNREGKDDSAN